MCTVKVVVNTECPMHKFSKNAFWWQFQWKELYGVSRQSKIPYISNHFAKCDHKGELSAVVSAIYYLKSEKV